MDGSTRTPGPSTYISRSTCSRWQGTPSFHGLPERRHRFRIEVACQVRRFRGDTVYIALVHSSSSGLWMLALGLLLFVCHFGDNYRDKCLFNFRTRPWPVASM